jgi:hypothetical protein
MLGSFDLAPPDIWGRRLNPTEFQHDRYTGRACKIDFM